MNKKGFLLVEVLMGLFLLGIINVTCLPILSTAMHNMILSKQKIDMLFIAESTIEQIKSFDYSQPNEQWLFDIRLNELIDMFNDKDSVNISLPLDRENSSYKYNCTIHKENNSNDLWEIRAEVSPIKKEKKIKDVTIIAFVSAHKKE